MKPSKRNTRNATARAERRADGKPEQSKYAAKGQPWRPEKPEKREKR